MYFQFVTLMAAAPASPLSSVPLDVRDEHLLSLCANFKEHLDSKAFSDITLVCGDQTFDCHKVVLSSGCEYFRKLLAEHDLNLLDLSEGQSDVIQQVLYFIYTGTCDITCVGIKGFLHITTKWKIPSLLRLCFKFIRENCTIRYAGVFYSLLLQYQDQPTLEVVSYFIREHFTEMYSRRSFGTIPISDFCDLLEHDEINVKNEDEVFDSLVELVEDQPADGDFKARFEVVRFQHITKDYLEGSVRSHPLMREVPQRDLIRDAIRYKYGKTNATPSMQRYWKIQQHHDIKAEGEPMQNTVVLGMVNGALQCIDKENAVVSHDTKLHCINDLKNLLVFSENAWNNVLNVKAFIDIGTAISKYKSGFVLVGACNKKFGKDVSYVDVSALAEFRLPALPESIAKAGVLSVGDDLYVIGGISNNDEQIIDTVLMLSKGNNHWTYMPRLQIPVKLCLCVLMDGVIYVLGVSSDDDSDEPKVQRLKLNDKNWTLCKKIPEDCSADYDGFIAFDDHVVIVKYDAFLKFDPARNKWTTDVYAKPLRDAYMTIMQHEKQLCAYVGEEGWVMSYDADSNRWLPSIRSVPTLAGPFLLFAI